MSISSPQRFASSDPILSSFLGLAIALCMGLISFAAWSDDTLADQEEVRLDKATYDPKAILTLSESTKLKRLRINNAEITDGQLELIGKISQLELLDLSGCNQVTDAGVLSLAKLSKLKNLSLGSPSITDASLEVICQLPSLGALTLQGCTIHGPGLLHLGKLTKLKEFGLVNSSAGDLALGSLAPGEIVKLKLRASGVTNQGVEKNLSRFPKLKSLDLGENQVGDSALQVIASCKIDDLSLLRTRVTVDGIALLVGMPMKRLNLDDIRGIDDSVIPHVLKLEQLEFLHLGKTQITDAGVSKLGQLANLKDLIINDTQVSAEAVALLQESSKSLRIKR
jgi:Leucine-rich repeat (LRR) protein